MACGDIENGKIQRGLNLGNHISKEEFLFDWFGNFGRVLGNPPEEKRKRYFSNDPNSIFDCITFGKKATVPAYITVQPFAKYGVCMGIEKLFYDFDYGKKSDKMTDKQKEAHKRKCAVEVMQFANYLSKLGIKPLILFSGNKGYHVYIFFDRVYTFDYQEYDFWKMVYKRLMERFKNKDYKYMDSSTIGDLQQFARIPFSIHQKTGKEVIIVNNRLKRDKIRSLAFYRTYGLKQKVIKEEAHHVLQKLNESMKEAEERKKLKKSKWEVQHGFVGEIRPCFTKRIEQGEMCHAQRLALLIEAFYSGIQGENELVDLFRDFKDFNESTTRYQVKWYLEHQNGIKPYRCSTIQEKGWCLEEDCPIWRARKRKYGN